MTGFPQRTRTQEELELLERRLGPQVWLLSGSTSQPRAAVLWLEARESWLRGSVDVAKPIKPEG
jgi:hypothetical protein